MGNLLHYAIVFLVVALVAAFFGFGGVAGTAMEGARILFWVAIVLFVVAAVVGLSSRATERVDARDGFGDEKVKAKPEPEPALNPADRDLMMAALTAVGPMALPPIARLVARNLPLLAVLGAAAFVLSRDAGDGVPESVQAAE